VLAAKHHTSLVSILMPWDGTYYVSIATSGYPAHVDVHAASSIAFFPLFPLLGRAVAGASGVGAPWGLILVSWIGGAAASVFGCRLAVEHFGRERGRRAGLLLAVFPGSVVAGLTYADALGVAFAAGALLASSRRRHLIAGLAGAAATATLSLLVVPLLAATTWSAVRERRLRALLAPLLSLCGGGAYLAYLWARTGSPFTWSRVERAGWLVHPSLPWQPLTAFSSYPFSSSGSGVVTIASIVVAGLGLVALVGLRAPGEWLILSVVVLVAVTFDGGAWIAPRFLFDAFPLVLALGVATPRRAFPLVALVSLAGLLLLLAAYSPANRVFLNP
jgi:hypothetical protein